MGTTSEFRTGNTRFAVLKLLQERGKEMGNKTKRFLRSYIINLKLHHITLMLFFICKK